MEQQHLSHEKVQDLLSNQRHWSSGTMVLFETVAFVMKIHPDWLQWNWQGKNSGFWGENNGPINEWIVDFENRSKVYLSLTGCRTDMFRNYGTTDYRRGTSHFSPIYLPLCHLEKGFEAKGFRDPFGFRGKCFEKNLLTTYHLWWKNFPNNKTY